MLAWPMPKVVLYAAMHAIEPFDDRQADERAAVSTALLVKAFTGEWVEPEKLFKSLALAPEDEAAAKARKREDSFRRFQLWALAHSASHTPIDVRCRVPGDIERYRTS